MLLSIEITGMQKFVCFDPVLTSKILLLWIKLMLVVECFTVVSRNKIKIYRPELIASVFQHLCSSFFPDEPVSRYFFQIIFDSQLV